MTPTSEAPTRAPRPLARLQSGLFLLAIGVAWPLLLSGRTGLGVESEMRKSAPPPSVEATLESWVSFPRRFERWYANHFALRNGLVHHHNFLKWVLLRTSPTDKVVRGRDDWVFIDESMTLTQIRGALPLEPEEVDAWVETFEERRAWLAERGAEYLLVIAPSKARIYPEFLPRGYEPVGPSRQDQVLEALAARTSVRFLDLADALIDERKNDRPGDLTYYKLGSHWTRRGAYRGWQEIVEAVPEVFEVRPKPIEELDRRLIEGSEGDSWGGRLYLNKRLRQEDWGLVLTRRVPSRPLPTGKSALHFTAPEGQRTDGPRVMLFHDSFGRDLRTVLARSCKTLTCFWRFAWELALIEREQPDLVIDVFIERKFVTADPTEEHLESQETLRARFDAATTELWNFSGDTMRAKQADQARLNAKLEGPHASYALARLAPLTGDFEAPCWLAVDVECQAPALIEILQYDPAIPPRFVVRRHDAARALARPGRQTLYFQLPIPGGRTDTWIGSPDSGVRVHAVAARR